MMPRKDGPRRPVLFSEPSRDRRSRGSSRCSPSRISWPTRTTVRGTWFSAGGLPAALIDFDLARPTTRVTDAVNALYWWAPLCHPQDRGPALSGVDVARRVRIFADAYGMDAVQRGGIVDAALRRQRNSAITMKAAAETDPVFGRWWDEGLKDKLPRAESWLTANAEALRRALT